MFKAEFTKMVKNKRFILLAVALFLITFPDLIDNWKWSLYYFVGWEWVSHPCNAAFLSSNSSGHIPQIIINWLLPIILLIMGCDSANRERKLGIKNIYITARGRKKYYNNKFAVSFLAPAMVMFLICMVNWVLSLIIFRGGVTFAGLERSITQAGDPFLYFQYQHPYFIYFCYIIVYSFAIGLCGLMCQALSVLINDIKIVYLLSFILWFLQLSIPPYLANALQPFTETTLLDTFLGILRFALMVFAIAAFALFMKRKKKDEI